MRLRIVYLHGFASSPGSMKASFFRSRLRELGLEMQVPDLAPDFRRVTITSQLKVAEPLVERGPVVLLGSSLGGYLATLLAERHPETVAGLVLFAPAFGFAERWQQRLGPEAMARWRSEGTLRVFHYGKEREERLSVKLLDDAATHASQPDPLCPTLAFAGSRDESVPLQTVASFTQARGGRELVVLDAGHEMTEVLDSMWHLTHGFLASLGAAPASAHRGF
jgi:pimeloyl-ACP methyl ester carboxylesterase